MAKETIAWHPGFASAIQLELGAYRDCLTYETEHELNRRPLRIDLLVIKKDPSVTIENSIARIFRGHNILEFKSEQDSLTIDDLYKTIAYACLYKAYGPEVDAIHARDITLTLVRRARPDRLFKALESDGCPPSRVAPGVYWQEDLIFPMQLVVTGELDPANHLWLSSLASDLGEAQVRELVNAAVSLNEPGDRLLADSVLDVVARANTDVVERLKEENMGKSLYEIMKPEIDATVAEAREKAIAEGTAFGMLQGMEQGMQKGMEQGMEKGMEAGRLEATRETIARMLRRGGFSCEEIADMTGSTVEDVRSVAESLALTVA